MIEINTIYTENCLSTMQRMVPGSVDMILTSPPYDKLRNYKGYTFPFRHIARNAFKVLKEGGVMVWVVGDSTVNGSETGNSFRQALFFMECGFRLHDTMIYRKENFIHLTHNRYEQAWEYMFVFSKGKILTFNPKKVKTLNPGVSYNLSRKGYCATIKEGAQRRRDKIVTTAEYKLASNIFTYTLGSQQTGHPAPFPDELAADHIKTWSNEGDVIYDPFLGSGTTAKVALQLNRKFIGSEIAPEYCEIARKRIHHLLNNLFTQNA